MGDRFAAAARVVDEAVKARAFPGASIEVGAIAGPLWRHAAGRLTYDADATQVSGNTLYDLASLTKVICTASLAMQRVDAGALDLAAPAGRYLGDWRGEDREDVTIRDLLAHSSGLTSYLPLFRGYAGRREFERAICELPFEYPPRTRSVYSDLGFILLGFILEDVHAKGPPRVPAAARNAAATLGAQFRRLARAVTHQPLAFCPPREWRERTAPTEVDAWRGRLLAGEVHDENAWALGGAAAHAGLFGTAAAVGDFARAVLRTIAGDPILASRETMRTFITRVEVPGSSRALGWDTMLPTSSCGTRLSPTAIGHTGFTGTSLWIDWERDFYVVLLTNRVHPTRDNNAIRAVRPQFHDAVAEAMEKSA